MESNDSPEIPERGETSDIPGLPSGSVRVSSETIVMTDILWALYIHRQTDVLPVNYRYERDTIS